MAGHTLGHEYVSTGDVQRGSQPGRINKESGSDGELGSRADGPWPHEKALALPKE